MNNTVNIQLAHRSIRNWKQDAVSEEIISTLYDVANRTSSSTAMQHYSIIRVKDPKKRAEIAEVCGQDYVKQAPEFFLFVVDCFRNYSIMKEMGENLESARDMDRFFQGFTDGAIACQNVVVAIESLGLGAVYFGSVLNDTKRIIEILGLPELTFPIVGLGFGYPNQDPALKPRMQGDLKFFEDGYKVQDSYLESIKTYDAELKTYYDLRNDKKPVDAFSDQVMQRLKNPMQKRSKMLNVVKDQGFVFGLDD